MKAPDQSLIADRCTFKAFSVHELEAQGELLRRCFETLGPAYRELSLRFQTLVDWIISEPDPQ
ncbi:MAG TPA: hypothetical protein VFN67_11605 [Polyangiales bacterium]|nr:hypothetical protein [Polyangiales bacterium]